MCSHLSYLNAVIPVGEVGHWLVLLVDDADAGLMGTANNVLNVLGRLAHFLKLAIDFLGGFNCGLRVEFS